MTIWLHFKHKQTSLSKITFLWCVNLTVGCLVYTALSICHYLN